ncbi:hypothetical protein N8590_03895 [bacterium]|jgi:hypothetical protein|nr:hypothetical protein [bacterium]
MAIVKAGIARTVRTEHARTGIARTAKMVIAETETVQTAVEETPVVDMPMNILAMDATTNILSCIGLGFVEQVLAINLAAITVTQTMVA